MNKFQVILLVAALLQVAFSRSVEESNGRIVGGSPANIADFPHSLAIIVLGAYICGASNIHRQWALTAAHCLPNLPVGAYSLRGGSTSRLSGFQSFSVARYISHPLYNSNTLDFDVGLIETTAGSPLVGTNVIPVPISPICNLACCQACAAGANVLVAGWGAIESGALPENLLQVSKPIVTNQVCSNFWTNINSRIFCTAVEEGRDSCNGDSGSAAVRNGVQVGIVSFGSAVCGDGSRPAGYARVEEPGIRNWIATFVPL